MNVDKIKNRLASQGWRNIAHGQAMVNNNYPGCGIYVDKYGVFRCTGHSILVIKNIKKWRAKNK